MKCGNCQEDILVPEDCTLCSACNSKYHYNCSVREVKWRNMTQEQKVKWLCVKCKPSKGVNSLSRANSASSSIHDSEGESTELDNVSIKSILVKINSRLDTLGAVKKTVDEMSESLGFLSGKYDELLTEVKNYKESNKKLEKKVEDLQADCVRKDDELWNLTCRFNALEQYGRGVNLEIHGVEELSEETMSNILENTAKALGLPYHPSEIQAAHRLPAKDSNTLRPPIILVQFTNKATKQQWQRQGRMKKLKSREIHGTSGTSLYFNDNLTPFYRGLLKETKRVAQEKKYEFVWVQHGNIRVRKSSRTREPIAIRSYYDLRKLE